MAGRKPNPWASFILRAGQVHENSDGTRIWAAIPADGITTLQRDVNLGLFQITLGNHRKRSTFDFGTKRRTAMLQFWIFLTGRAIL